MPWSASETIKTFKLPGGVVLAVEVGKTIFLEKQLLLSKAGACGVSIVAIEG